MSRVYSQLKAFCFPDRLEGLKKNEPVIPVHVRIKPINACNHHCWYCAYRADDLELGRLMQVKDVLPEKKMLEIAQDLIDLGVKAVTFSGGGEPLTYPHLPQMIEKLSKGGIAVASLTNGSLLTGKVADSLAHFGTWVRVSMDGWDAKSYARLRGVTENEFGRICANIQAFNARNSRCSLGVNFIISQDNTAHVLEFLKFAKSLGVRHVKLSGCVVSNDGQENNLYHDPIRALVELQVDKARKLEDKNFEIVNHYHQMETCFDKTYRQCHMLHLLTVIGADAHVYTCQDKAYTQSGDLGSIAERSFKDFWLDENTQSRLRAINPSLECRHHCVAHLKNGLLDEFTGLDASQTAFV